MSSSLTNALCVSKRDEAKRRSIAYLKLAQDAIGDMEYVGYVQEAYKSAIDFEVWCKVLASFYTSL